MRKQRVRTLKELHEITQQISEPEITPVLKGSCRIQGPVDEVDIDIETNLAVFSAEKGFGKHYLNEDIPMKASGTCNVCAAPCSSCMHFSRTVSFMESKAGDGNSENSCGRKEADNFSFSNSEMPPFFKSKPCSDRMQEASETSKIVSTTSSHDSYSENTESKGTVRTSDMHEISEGVDMPLKLTSFERVEENQPLVVDYIKSQLSQEPAGLNEVQRALPNQQGDPHELECHGDNISHVTGLRDVNIASSHLSTSLGGKNMSSCTSASSSAFPSEGFKMAAQAQAADSDIADIQDTRQLTAKFAKEYLQTKSSSYDPPNAGFCNDNTESSSLNGKPSSKEECLHSNAKIGNSLNTSADLKNGKENSTSQRSSEDLEEPLESSLGWQIATGFDEQKTEKAFNATIHSNNEVSNVKFDASTSGTYQFRKTENGGNGVISKDDAIIQEIPDEQHEKPSSSVVNVQGVQPMLQGDCPDQDSLEDDVEICDICGDAGREDLLAVCSRCSVGAEHTYCMRVMLDKVPEGWLCEECKLNEDMDKMEKSDTGKLQQEMPVDKTEKTEIVSSDLKAPSSIEKLQNVGSSCNPKLLPKLDISATAAEAPLIVKSLQSPQMSAKKPSGGSEMTSLSNKKLSDTSLASVLIGSPSRKSMLSRESSFKNMDAGKPKLGNFVTPSGSQSSTGSQVFSRSLTHGPNSSKVQGQVQCTRGPLSRSCSFSSVKAKAKQGIKSISQKPQFTKEHATSDTKEGFGRTLSKSASCKNINSGHSNVTESTTKSQSVSLHHPEESRVLQHSKEKAIERKNSFVLTRTSTSSSSASAPSVLIAKAEAKATQNDGKGNSVPESNLSHLSKGMEDSHDKGMRDLRKQESHASKTSGNHPATGACSFVDQKQTHVASKEDAPVGSSGDINTGPQRISTYSCSHDEKFKESSLIGSSRSLTLPSQRIPRCQRCNETGHSTQYCSIDKLRVSALKPSIERTSREVANKGNKWKDAVDAAISKGRVQRKSPDQSEEILSTDICSEIVSQNHSSSSSSCVKGLSTMEGAADKQSGLRNSTAGSSKTIINNVKQYASQMMRNVCTSRDGDAYALSTRREELKEKPSTQILSEHHAVFVDPSRVSALPAHEYIWQGSFEVKRSGRLPELSDGFQAHLSTCASPKVLKVVNKFSNTIQLEEVARLSSWPLQFQENSPTEENIALFFFAKDVASYEKSYSKLLDSILRNDLALKGIFDGIELLIFPSSKLPEKCQRWNRLLFLWGVFRERRSSCPHMSSGQSRRGRSNNYSKDIANGLSMQPVTKVPTSEKESSHEGMDKGFLRHDKSMKTEADDLKNLSFLEAESASSHIVNSHCHKTPILEKINEVAMDSKCHQDRSASNPSAAPDLLTIKSEQTSSYDPFHQPIVQKNTAQFGSETHRQQKEFVTGSDRRKEDKLSVVRNDGMQAVHSHTADGLSSKHMITSDLGPPDLNVDSHDMKEVYYEITVENQLSCLPVVGTSVVGSKDEERMQAGRLEKGTASDSDIPMDKSQDIRWLSGLPDPKRPRSHSPEIISHLSGELSISTSVAMPWKRRTECISQDEDRESKRIKIHSGVPACSSSVFGTFVDKSSSKVHPLLANFLNEQLHPDNVQSLPTFPESSGNSERHFFPLDDPTSVVNVKTGSTIPLQILSSDDEFEQQQECDAPNLELALGADRRPMKQELHPLSLPTVGTTVGTTKNQGELPDPAAPRTPRARRHRAQHRFRCDPAACHARAVATPVAPRRFRRDAVTCTVTNAPSPLPHARAIARTSPSPCANSTTRRPSRVSRVVPSNVATAPQVGSRSRRRRRRTWPGRAGRVTAAPAPRPWRRSRPAARPSTARPGPLRSAFACTTPSPALRFFARGIGQDLPDLPLSLVAGSSMSRSDRSRPVLGCSVTLPPRRRSSRSHQNSAAIACGQAGVDLVPPFLTSAALLPVETGDILVNGRTQLARSLF